MLAHEGRVWQLRVIRNHRRDEVKINTDEVRRLQVDRIMSGQVASVEDLMPVFDIGRNTAYAMVKTGQIRSIRIGRRIVIPTAAIRELLGA
jgi:Helix-turn-helix domain